MAHKDKLITISTETFSRADWLRAFQHPVFIPLLLFSAAFFIRFHFLTVNLYENNFDKYVWIAKKLLAGEDIGERLLDFSPLYTYLNVVFQYLFLGDLFFIILFQNLLGSINSVLIYLIGKRLYSRPVGIIAGIIIASFKNIVLYEFILEPITIILFLNSITILSLIQTSDSIIKKSGLFKILKLCYISGIFLGLGVIARPNILLFVPLAYIWIYLSQKRADGIFKYLTVYYFLFTFGILTSVSPILIRNHKIFDKFSLAIMSPGQVFHQGNSIEATGLGIYYPSLFKSLDIYKNKDADSIHELYRDLARDSVGMEISVEETSRFWTVKALNYIRSYPVEYLKLLFNKFVSFFNQYEMHDISFVYYAQNRLAGFPFVPFNILIPSAILGIFILCKKKKYDFLLFSIVSTYFISNFIFFISSRQRLPVIPFLAVFSACFIVYFWQYIVDKKIKKIFFSIIFFIVLSIFSSFRFDIISASSKEKVRSYQTFKVHNFYARKHQLDNNPALTAREIKTAIARIPARWKEIGEGNIFYGDEGLIGGAIRIAEKLYPHETRDQFENYNMGYLYILGKEYDKAEAIFLKLENQIMLGNIYLSREVLDQAMTFYEKASENKDFDLAAFTQLAALYEKMNFPKKSIALMQKLKKIYDDISISYYLGSAYFKVGMNENALMEWKKVAGFFPEFPIIHIYLSSAYAKMGLLDKAYKEFETAIRLVPDLYVELNDLETLLEKDIKNNPDNTTGYLRLGKLYMKKGEFKKALSFYHQGLNLIKNNRNINSPSDNEIISINYYIPFIYYNLGDEYLLSGDIDKAIQYFEKAGKFSYSKAELYLKLARSYHLKGITDKAIENYKLFLTKKPKEAEVYKILGNFHYEKGEYFNAADLYQQCINYNSNDADCYYNQGLVFFKMNVLPKALEKYRKAIELNPDEPDFHYNLGLTYKRLGENKKANEEFRLAARGSN